MEDDSRLIEWSSRYVFEKICLWCNLRRFVSAHTFFAGNEFGMKEKLFFLLFVIFSLVCLPAADCARRIYHISHARRFVIFIVCCVALRPPTNDRPSSQKPAPSLPPLPPHLRQPRPVPLVSCALYTLFVRICSACRLPTCV